MSSIPVDNSWFAGYFHVHLYSPWKAMTIFLCLNFSLCFGMQLYSEICLPAYILVSQNYLSSLSNSQSLCQSLSLQLSYDGKTIALPFNFSIVRWAAETRQVLNNAKLPDGVCFYNIYGTSFDTPFDVWYVRELLYLNQNKRHEQGL